jgi:glycosyltransferase involved in cell wall biosynthesis
MQQTNQTKSSALIICFTHLHKDPRVLRQISWLKDKYEITTLGYSHSNAEGVNHVQYDQGQASPILKKLNRVVTFFSGNYDSFYWNANRTGYVEKLQNKKFDLIIANDYDTLPVGVRLKEAQNTTLLFDAHEYSPLEFTESFRWRVLQQPLIKHICREYISRATIATTVCQTIAETYEREFGKKFEIITNATEFESLQPSPSNSGKIRMIYHGGASQSRQTHKQIEMMRFLDNGFELSLMILGQPDYIESLKKIAQPFKNVKFLPPVGTNEIAAFTNQFDVGIYSLPPTNFNNKYALPNKFFEFIQARLAVVIAPSPEMARIVREFDLGVVAEDFSPESMAASIKTLTPEKIDYFKAQANKYAYELSAEKNRERLLQLIESAG